MKSDAHNDEGFEEWQSLFKWVERKREEKTGRNGRKEKKGNKKNEGKTRHNRLKDVAR